MKRTRKVKEVKAKNITEFKTKAARSRAISKLRKQGYNYFVCYDGAKDKPALQFAKAKQSVWFKKYAKRGVLITGA